MKPQTLLFSPNGRIGPRSFWRGVVLLVGAQVVMQVLGVFVPQNLAVIYAIVSFVYLIALFWGYFCVYAKRFHDADYGAVWFVASAMGALVLNLVLTAVAFPLLFPDVVDAWREVLSSPEGSQRQAAAEKVNLAMVSRTTELIAWNLANLAIINAVTGWAVASLRSVAGTNRFGPPEGGDLSVF